MKKIILISFLVAGCTTLETVYVPNNYNKILKNLKLMKSYTDFDLKEGIMDSSSHFDYNIILDNTIQGVEQMKKKNLIKKMRKDGTIVNNYNLNTITNR